MEDPATQDRQGQTKESLMTNLVDIYYDLKLRADSARRRNEDPERPRIMMRTDLADPSITAFRGRERR